MKSADIALWATLSLSIIAMAPIAHSEDLELRGATLFSDKNIVENAIASLDHTTLGSAVKAAGLAETLEGKGPFTVFAPTNEAFAKLPKGTYDDLLQPDNKELLAKILSCHIVSGEEMSNAMLKMIKADNGEYDIKTVGGCILRAKQTSGMITLTSSSGKVARLTEADMQQSNGVVHSIDSVLLPEETPKVHASRIFSGPHQYPPTSFKAYGILAFPSIGSVGDKDRQTKICNAYVSAIGRATEVPSEITDQMVTVWPIDTDTQAATIMKLTRENSCGPAIEHYGIVISQQALLDAKMSGVDVEGRGPFLLAWSPPNGKGKAKSIVLKLNLSDVDDGPEADEIMRQWVVDIEENSAIWNPQGGSKGGWDVAAMKTLIRNWANKYGKILDLTE